MPVGCQAVTSRISRRLPAASCQPLACPAHPPAHPHPHSPPPRRQTRRCAAAAGPRAPSPRCRLGCSRRRGAPDEALAGCWPASRAHARPPRCPPAPARTDRRRCRLGRSPPAAPRAATARPPPPLPPLARARAPPAADCARCTAAPRRPAAAATGRARGWGLRPPAPLPPPPPPDPVPAGCLRAAGCWPCGRAQAQTATCTIGQLASEAQSSSLALSHRTCSQPA